MTYYYHSRELNKRILTGMPRDSYFNASWMENELYKGWLREKNKTTAYCRICSKDIPVGNKGEVSIKRHAGLPPYENQGTQHKKGYLLTAITFSCSQGRAKVTAVNCRQIKMSKLHTHMQKKRSS